MSTIEISIKYRDQNLGTFIDFMTAGDDYISKMVAITGLKRTQLLNVPMANLEKSVSAYVENLKADEKQFNKFITIDGIKFGFHPNLKSITFGEWLDCIEFSKNYPHTIDRLMAVLYRPVTSEINDVYTIEDYDSNKNEHYAKLMRKVKLPLVNGCMLFFSTLTRDLLNSFPEYLEEEMSRLKKELEELQNEEQL
jgi:hypothetical protein